MSSLALTATSQWCTTIWHFFLPMSVQRLLLK